MTEHLFIYVVDRDFGFAPNPFHGYCTLATCKPQIRAHAKVNDWVMGVGGARLKATGKCIFLLKVSEILTFNEYWSDARFEKKKPLRNGSLVMMVGDNIYHHDSVESWIQEDSHHSNHDGSCNSINLQRDTSSSNVLISKHFYYFGKSAPEINLALIGYKNHIGHSKKPLDDTINSFIASIELQYKGCTNLVLDDPFNFMLASKRVDQATGKIS